MTTSAKDHQLTLGRELFNSGSWAWDLPEPGWPALTGMETESPPTAVIDIGSGSARAVVMQVNRGGGIEILAQQQMHLELMTHVNDDGALDPQSVALTLDAMEDFVQVCRAHGVQNINAVGTAALRESSNAAEITETAARKFGVSFRIISGQDEAAYCFVGAVHGLPVTQGLLADLGGGSMEVVGFADRSLEFMRTLPLGGLRISNRFGLNDRPAAEDLAAAARYVRECLASAQIPRLGASDTLVGSGGSIRLLSKLDRRRMAYPILKMHGYYISGNGLADLTESLAQATRAERAAMTGMNQERTHSIVGGVIVAQVLLEHTGAGGILVSGQGLREGLARHPEPLPQDQPLTLPQRTVVRAAGLSDLVQRFALRFWQRGPRRADFARRLANAAWRGRHRRLTSSLQCAALLLEIGSAIDFYNRLGRTAAVVARSDLPGFSHRESAQVAGMLLVGERGRLPRRYRHTPVLTGGDKRRLGQAAAVLLVADELDRRLPTDCPADAVAISRKNGGVAVVTPIWTPLNPAGLEKRWEAEFKQPIHVRTGSDGG